MRALNLSFQLPTPWQPANYTFANAGAINFFVGPNGTGKSRFASALKAQLEGMAPGRCAYLGTDRLAVFQKRDNLIGLVGNATEAGFSRGHFQHYDQLERERGYALKVFPLLDEKPHLRIRLEATLSKLFDRYIKLEWDAGILKPVSRLRTGQEYRLDSEECHGIREMLVLLTYIYNDETDFLLIDEPELNLHPQFQSFFMQELRKVAGDPATQPGKKTVFLITHSPIILELDSLEELASITSFKLDHSVPVSLNQLTPAELDDLRPILGSLTHQNKQLFYSDRPIFLEGVTDYEFIARLQQARGKSFLAAGSCLIESGGKNEVGKYVRLCAKLNKNAFFLYDLDSLFVGTLRKCIDNAGVVSGFLTDIGIDPALGQKCLDTEKKAFDLAVLLMTDPATNANFVAYKNYLNSLNLGTWAAKGADWKKAIVATLIFLNRFPGDVPNGVQAQMTALMTDFADMTLLLKQKNVLILARGSLEHYFPSLTGNGYALTDSQKNTSLASELLFLDSSPSDADILARYNDLLNYIDLLPAQNQVDVMPYVEDYISEIIRKIQRTAGSRNPLTLDECNAILTQDIRGFAQLFELAELNIQNQSPLQLNGRIILKDKLGIGERHIRFTEQTNAGTETFSFEIPTPTVPQTAPTVPIMPNNEAAA